jgi:hypothetical protein
MKEAEDNHTLYVRVNHATMVVVDYVKTPNLAKFLEKNIQPMLEAVAADFKRMQAINENKDTEKIKAQPYKVQIPVMEVTLEEWENLTVGLPKQTPIKHMTICFGQTRLICDLRIQKDEMIKKQLQSLSEKGFMGKPDPDFFKNRKKSSKILGGQTFKIILPDKN